MPDRFLRASDFDAALGEKNNPDWKTVAFDDATGDVIVPNGSTGFRWGEQGKWNIEEKESGGRPTRLSSNTPVRCCPVLLIVLLFRSFLFEPFKIPSGSMIPMLLVGDFILVNKYAYGLRLPVVHTRLVAIGEPKRGDVVVFRFPENPAINFIKRLVGLPGDTVSYRDKRLYVNGEAVGMDPVGIYTSADVKCDTPRSDARRYRENLEGVEHEILVHEGTSGRDGQ